MVKGLLRTVHKKDLYVQVLRSYSALQMTVAPALVIPSKMHMYIYTGYPEQLVDFYPAIACAKRG